MPYMPRKYKRRVVRKPKTIAKMATGKKTSIQKLAGAVARLQRAQRNDCEYLNYGYTEDDIPMVSPFYQSNLMRPSSWSAIFGTGTNDAEANRIIHKNFGIECRVSLENLLNNEEDTINFTAFLVSLKDDGNGAYNTSTGALSLSANQHYYQQQGFTMLNKKVFNIHKIKRFTLTNFGASLNTAGAQSQYGADCRWYWKIPTQKVIQATTGDWRSLSTVPDPSRSYHLLIFNDNDSLDGENPTMNLTAVHTLRTVS